MGLTQSQRTIVEKARSLGAGGQGIFLTDGMFAYLVQVIADDLGLRPHFPELHGMVPPFFGTAAPSSLTIEGLSFLEMFERLLSLNPDADTYFACLAALHKARLKYERILQTQPIPTIEQVGPRSLLQYGQLSSECLAGLLFWRKWFYDIDNRAAQETGYLFEPIIAYAIGGSPAGSKRSPIKRSSDPTKARQVDCIREKRAYEFKLRVTIAASGQGRWGEEMEFPADCRKSGYTPVLIVLDATPNEKLDQLRSAFLDAGGETYAGADAWNHLDAVAGKTMALFLERYIRTPLQSLLATEIDLLPNFSAEMGLNHISLRVGRESIKIDRSGPVAENEAPDEPPTDAADILPGP